MNQQPTSPVTPSAVQPGLRVRTALRAGAGNPLEETAESLQSWLQDLWQSVSGAVSNTPDSSATSS
ncbi:MAG: hypothetical protein ACKO4U_08685 [Caldilinea sp.]